MQIMQPLPSQILPENMLSPKPRWKKAIDKDEIPVNNNKTEALSKSRASMQPIPPEMLPEKMLSPKPRWTRVLEADKSLADRINLEVVPEYQFSTQGSLSYSSNTMASDHSQFSEEVDLWLKGGTAQESSGAQSNRDPVQRSTFATSTSSMESGSVWYLLAMLLPTLSLNNGLRWTPRTPMVHSSELIVSTFDEYSNSNNLQFKNPMRKADNTFSVLGVTEIFLSRLSRFCGQARAQIRRLAGDDVARNIFASALDLVLVIYAIGFIVLSLYQASVIR